MDDPIVGPKTPIRLRRTCERNRLEKQLLIDAYETLVALIMPGEEKARPKRELCDRREIHRKQAKLAEPMEPAA